MARKHRGLGKGLDALIPRRTEIEQEFSHMEESGAQIFFSDEPEEDREPEPETPAEPAVIVQEAAPQEIKAEIPENEEEPARTVRISQVEPNRKQPRRTFDEEALQELADSIAEYGIIQPLLVQDCGDHYEIIAGERRWRAAIKAGISEVPVIVRKEDKKKILELSLIENIQREALSPIEEASAFKELMEVYGLTQEEVAARVSKSRSAVANALRLLRLDERVQKMLSEGAISMGHARALLALEDMEMQYKTALRIEEGGLSVREAEALVKQLLKKAQEKPREHKRDAEREELRLIYRNLEEQLCQKLGTKVAIRAGSGSSGKLQIDFYSYEDLEKMIDRLS